MQSHTTFKGCVGLLAVFAGVSLLTMRLPGRSFAQLPALPRVAPPAAAALRPAPSAGLAGASSGVQAAGGSAGVAALLMLAGAAAAAAGRSRASARARAAGASVVACRSTPTRGSPQQIPVLNVDGEQVDEETLHFGTFTKETANYVVHKCFTVWQYQQMPFTAFMIRRSDQKKGKKPWAQKGSGRARQGSTYSPTFGRSATNKAPHGLDNKRKKQLGRQEHAMAISTVLQSKWRCMKIIDGIEDWDLQRQKPLEARLKKWTSSRLTRPTLLITRQGFGQVHKTNCILTPESYNSPLYLSGRHIKNLTMRRPRDIDPTSDALFHALKARRVLISREAFADLDAKFHAGSGWVFRTERQILVAQMQALAKEYPTDRDEEIKIARTLPRSIEERENWAKDMRDQLALEAAA